MALTASYGKFCDSGVYLYEVKEGGCKAGMRLLGAYRFPPMVQELVSDGSHTYFLFESSATCYSTKEYWKCSYPVDRICALSTLDLFLRNHGEGYQSCASRLPILGGLCIYDELYQERRYWQQYRG